MKIKKQICSLEQAKKLKRLDITQDSIWFFSFYLNPKTTGTQADIFHQIMVKELIQDNEGDAFDVDTASAFTVAELGEMLGDEIQNIRKIAGKWIIHWWPIVMPDFLTEAEARAEVLISLIERGKINVNVVNKLLTE